MRKILTILSIIYGGFCGMAIACESNEIDVLGDGANCETAKFTITTTNLSANTEFKFYMSAMGTFYVDWGDGTVDTITRNDTTETLYDHTYTTAGVKTMRFGGLATGYNKSPDIAAIRFGSTGTTPNLIRSLTGNFASIFPYLQNHDDAPRFYYTFANATKLVSIPNTLFYGYTTGIGSYMFFGTFSGCKSLITIPSGLFRGLTITRSDMFAYTFSNCTSLTDIPADLFASLTTSSARMFYATFAGCTSLTNIPENLFSSFTVGARGMFTETFRGCNSLTRIPDHLFYNIETITDISVFSRVFSGCTGISGYIPPSLFAGLIANGSPTATNIWDRTFLDTNLATSCPSGTVQFITGYEDYWDGKVSCVDENLTCNAGEYLPAHWFKCEPCPQNNYCPGGTYPYSETIPSGAISCPNNLYAPAGMSSLTQCGRILHIGENVVYLHSVKKTTPALHVDIDQDGTADYFGNMTTLDVPMTNGTDKKLKLQYDGVTYSVYDDSVDLTEYQN